MAVKPENAFIASVHKQLPLKRVYHEKTCNPFRSGIADVWYSGLADDMWVEYKFIESLPRSEKIQPELSPRQIKWLGERHAEGRNVAVILGTRNGGVLYRDLDWLVPYSDKSLLPYVRTRLELAQWILDQVGESPCRMLSEQSKQPLSL